MSTGIIIPITCQTQHCGRRWWVPTEKYGYYAFYFLESEYDKQRMRVKRLGGIEKEDFDAECPICHVNTKLFLMKRQSALRFNRQHPDVPMVTPGEMRLPGEEQSLPPMPGTAMPSKPNFINIETKYPVSKEYSDIIDEINTCYEYEAYSSALVMIRKLVENLIVDILRLKYAPINQHDEYYDEANKRFLPFEKLLDNFEKILPEYERMAFTKDHLGIVKGLRKTGNKSAHSIIDLVDEKKIESYRSNANNARIALIRVVGIVQGIMNVDGSVIKKAKGKK